MKTTALVIIKNGGKLIHGVGWVWRVSGEEEKKACRQNKKIKKISCCWQLAPDYEKIRALG
jgi:hypothetical protein